MKPEDLFDRDSEWSEFSKFTHARTAGLTIGILSGRRRAGKSYFLRRLAQRGIYYQGIQEERTPALGRVGRLIADARGMPGAELKIEDWKTAINMLLDLAKGAPVVLDEYPYLLQRSPELSSVLQLIYDERRQGPGQRLILCGSSMSTMHHLLSGSQPLRGRAQVDMRMGAFDYRLARSFWKIKDHATAFLVDALIGGAPGYRDLIAESPPQNTKEFSEWVGHTVMNPSHALYREDEFLLREDPKLAEQSLYRTILGAVAAGERTPTRLGGRIGRDRTALSALLNNLMTAGFLRKETELDSVRAVTYLLQDPIVRFSQLVLAPHRHRLDERQWKPVWTDSEPTWRSQIVGPHFDYLSHVWLRSYASKQTVGGNATRIGKLVVADRLNRTSIELDAVVLGDRDQVLVVGEAKATVEQRSVNDLLRLEHARSLLGPKAARARLMLISRSGFDRALRAKAKVRNDVELVDLERLYEGT
jgi:uncharacterized protein